MALEVYTQTHSFADESDYKKTRRVLATLKKENDDCTESSVTTANDGPRLRQILLLGSVELRKIWDSLY